MEVVMKDILIFAGTSEGRKLAQVLDENRIRCLVCVATEYGECSMPERKYIKVHTGRMDKEQMKELLESADYEIVVDGTHPYAQEVSSNLKMVCSEMNFPYLRLIREESGIEGEYIKAVQNIKEAAEAANKIAGNLLLTTGSKELPEFIQRIEDKDRVYARVLPSVSVLSACERAGLKGNQMIAMQGPFTEELNYAMIMQLQISCMITKESGVSGGFPEKIAAARQAGIPMIVVGRPVKEEGLSLEDAILALIPDRKKRLYAVGIGMGSPDNLTKEAVEICNKADILFGAERILKTVKDFHKTMVPIYKGEEIKAYLKEHKEYQRPVVVLSGDVGFYSGGTKLKEILTEYAVEFCCGISTVVYLAAKLCMSWEDIKLLSEHGRKANLIGYISQYPKVFVLLGNRKIKDICKEFLQYNMGHLEIIAAHNLSYKDESILRGRPEEFLEYDMGGINGLLVLNKEAGKDSFTGGIPDSFFIRGKVPMTKEEIRAVSIHKLQLKENSVCYDIGAGSGSVAVECALRCLDGKVYAIERKKEAIALIVENKYKSRAGNLEIIEGSAPQMLETLEPPTHVFIGGSGGHLKDIIKVVQRKNPIVRIVINIIALETLQRVIDLLHNSPEMEIDIVQVQVTGIKKIGEYHMLEGKNPVFVVTLQNKGGGFQ